MTYFLKPRNLAFAFSEVWSDSDKILEKSEIDSLWEEYWTKHGENIVLETWNRLYCDYILSENNESVISNEKEESILEEDHKSDWESLWSDHWTQQQYYVYSVFKENYHAEFDPSLVEITLEEDFKRKLGLPTSFIGRGEKTNNKNEEQLSNSEEETLKNLGLPTQFSGKNSRGVYLEDFSESEEEEMDETDKIKTGRVKKKNKNRRGRNQKIPEYIQKNQSLLRYWKKRFSLFSRFDEGIRLDEESWYSVTPENVASQLAKRINCNIIVDAFCGCGGNSIQFAKSGKRVISIDIDEGKILKAKHNAKVYKVDDKIDFIVGDFLKIYKDLKGIDAIFLSPPWGGIDYKKSAEYDIETQLQPIGASLLFEKCREITDNIAIFLPRNSDTKQIVRLAGVGKKTEIEKNFLDRRFVGITAFFGGLIKS
ncbi:TGS1 family protein [Megaselia abdita]